MHRNIETKMFYSLPAYCSSLILESSLYSSRVSARFIGGMNCSQPRLERYSTFIGTIPYSFFSCKNEIDLKKNVLAEKITFCSEFMFSNKEEIALGGSYGKKKSPQTKRVTMLKNCFKIHNTSIPRSRIRTFLKKYRKANNGWHLRARNRFLVL